MFFGEGNGSLASSLSRSRSRVRLGRLPCEAAGGGICIMGFEMGAGWSEDGDG